MKKDTTIWENRQREINEEKAILEALEARNIRLGIDKITDDEFESYKDALDRKISDDDSEKWDFLGL